jgi:hypothetical protein
MVDRETIELFGWLFRDPYFQRRAGFGPAIVGNADRFGKPARFDCRLIFL